MAYDEVIADRIRERLHDVDGVSERNMFGGVCFMVFGNMACGPVGEHVIFRVGPDAYEDALKLPGAGEMQFTGRPMRGFVQVDNDVLEDEAALDEWVGRGLAFAQSLPAK